MTRTSMPRALALYFIYHITSPMPVPAGMGAPARAGPGPGPEFAFNAGGTVAAPGPSVGPALGEALGGGPGSGRQLPAGHGGWSAPASPAAALAGQLTVDSDARDDSRLNWRWL
jgi:hypothetical protein